MNKRTIAALGALLIAATTLTACAQNPNAAECAEADALIEEIENQPRGTDLEESKKLVQVINLRDYKWELNCYD